MNAKGPSLTVFALAGVMIGVLAVVGIQAAWRYVVAFEADFVPPGLQSRLMHRKSHALQDALEAVLRGKLDRVEPAVARIERYTDAMERFLDTDAYAVFGGEYRRSLDALKEAARRDDRKAAKAAILRVESACIDCHMLLNENE